MKKYICYCLILNLTILNLTSCGWQHIARSGSLTDDVESMQLLYHEHILDEISGDTPPLIDSSWNQHWTSIIATLEEEKSERNQKLANYILSERRKKGLPELVY